MASRKIRIEFGFLFAAVLRGARAVLAQGF